jgi:hypothetical protein
MAIDEAQLKVFFVHGLASVETLLESLEGRAGYRGGLMDMLAQPPKIIAKLPAEIDEQMVTMVNGSMGELTEEMQPLLTLLNQERAAWAALAKAIREKTDEKALRTVTKGFQKLLKGIHEKEQMLLPENLKEKTLENFIESMFAIKKKRVMSAAGRT